MGEQNNADFLDDFVVTVRKPKTEDKPLLPELKRLPATVKQVKKKKLTKSNSVRAHFTFVISAGKYKGQYAWGSVPLHEEVTEKADLYKWMCAILGKASLDVDDNVRMGDLVGRPVEIMVKNTKSGSKTYQNVTEVLTPENDAEEEKAEPAAKEEKEIDVEQDVKDADKEDSGLDDIVEETSNEGSSGEISEDDLPF